MPFLACGSKEEHAFFCRFGDFVAKTTEKEVPFRHCRRRFHRAFSDLRRVLNPGGRIIPNSGHDGMGYVLKGFLLAPLMAQQE
jgi:hypothetical protein